MATRRVTRAVLSLASLFAVATAFIGFLHTARGRPLLMKLAGSSCPMGKVGGADAHAAWHAAVQSDRGDRPAKERFALGFELDRATLQDIRAWQARTGAACVESREGMLVQCASDTITELAFAFAPHGPLVSVTTLYSKKGPDESAAIASRIQTELAERLGTPDESSGSFQEPGTTATLTYRFDDYAANVISMRIPGSGCAVRERYASIR